MLSHTGIYCFDDIVPKRYYLIQKPINTNSFHGHVQEDIISDRKIINTNNFHGYVQEEIISYRKL